MKNYFNIENKKNRDDSYTAYDGAGRSWRVFGSYKNWSATAAVTQQGMINLLIGFDTLQEISVELSKIK